MAEKKVTVACEMCGSQRETMNPGKEFCCGMLMKPMAESAKHEAGSTKGGVEGA